MKNPKLKERLCIFIFSFTLCALRFAFSVYAQDIKKPNVSGAFYPADPQVLRNMVDAFIEDANPAAPEGQIFALICPHAGYEFSGSTAAFGYRSIKDKPYNTVIVIAPSHYYSFSSVSVYQQGSFETPLGFLEVDSEFAKNLLNKDKNISFVPSVFEREHSLEVQLPFLQRALAKNSFKIVPIIMGDVSLSVCQRLADLLKEAIGERKDVLVVASSDMAHRYDYTQVEQIDNLTMSYLERMDTEGLYYGFRENKTEMCGMLPVIAALSLSKKLGHNKLSILKYTNSAAVTGKKIKGLWTVGYVSCAIDRVEGEEEMLNKNQKEKLLNIARRSIETYLKTGEKLKVQESDPLLSTEMGAFVTLQKHGELRGCIGNLVASQPLYLTVRDMAVEAAVGDPRFLPLESSELTDVEIEISVLSPLRLVESAEEIQMGKHGVLIKRGFKSGVFLPQVATETGWSKEEFLSNLCVHKAGLSPSAWKDKDTQIYIFTASVFSEKESVQ